MFIVTVWFTNGLLCKVFNLVPRHRQIVQEILHIDRHSSGVLTVLIGLSEVIMGVWILTKYRSHLNAVAQITIVAIMNLLEFIFVPDLLLWGRLNSVFALLFIGLVYYNEFVLHKKLKLQTQ